MSEPRSGASKWSVWSCEALLSAPAGVFGPSVVAIGMFDGVHLGHRRILEEAVALARGLGCKPLALTFDRHPQRTLAPKTAPPLITSFEERIDRILEARIEHVVAVEFDPNFAALEPDDFINRVLRRLLDARGVVVGYNFRFGKGAKGDRDLLQAAASEHGFVLRAIDAVMRGGAEVSSTRVRRFLEEGDVRSAAELLGRAFSLTGEVVHGDARGRTLGFPTANIALVDEIIRPKDGVYLTQASSAGMVNAPSLTVVSERPSFGASDRRVECYLLDVDRDLYGLTLSVSFLDRLRDIVRFDSVEALKAAIARDVEAARRYFAGAPAGVPGGRDSGILPN